MHATYKVLLFDLDGTISDPKEGIEKSIRYALQKMGVQLREDVSFETFIGPPLHVSFAEHYNFTDEEVKRAMTLYRERFKEKGLYENQVYEQVLPLLCRLKKAGYRLIVATSKPTPFAEVILSYFHMHHLFDDIVGSHLDGTRSSKAEIIEYILQTNANFLRSEFVMIGDRKHDIMGAHQQHIDSIGVLYGYGSEEEIEGADPTHIVQTVEQLGAFLGINVGEAAIKSV